MSNRSKIALIVLTVIWIVDLLFSIFAFTETKGYSIMSLIILPISLLVYLVNYYGDDEKALPEKKGFSVCTSNDSQVKKEEEMTTPRPKIEGDKFGEEKNNSNKE